MSKQRLEFKVGLFVFLGLVLIAVLMINFSKGASLFKPTYTVYLKTVNVGGLKPQAKVMISGVEVGSVKDITLSSDGKIATVELELLEKYKIYKDAQFTIDALGFLGDQYVAVKPAKNEGEPLKDKDEVTAKEPFDMQELARASLGFVNRLDTTAQRLNDAISRVDRMLLNEETLTNFSMAISNFLVFSDHAIEAADGVKGLFSTNSSPVNVALSNFVVFSRQLNTLADELNKTVITNEVSVTIALSNVQQSSAILKQMLTDVNAGVGVAGTLLKDNQLKLEMSSAITNLNSVASNLSLFSSNLNSRGLWSVLWKPKPQKKTDGKR